MKNLRQHQIRMKAALDGQDGFTLIEAMIALAMFAIAISAVLMLEVNAMGTHARSRNFVNEVNHIGSQVELLGPSLPFQDDRIQNLNDGDDPYTDANLPDKTVKEDNHGPWVTTYWVDDDSIVQGLKVISITNQRNQKARKYFLRQVKPNIR